MRPRSGFLVVSVYPTKLTASAPLAWPHSPDPRYRPRPAQHRNVGAPIDADTPTIPADRNPPGVDIQRPGADQISLGRGTWILGVDVWIPRRGYPLLDADGNTNKGTEAIKSG
jgi:hypothetical protein